MIILKIKLYHYLKTGIKAHNSLIVFILLIFWGISLMLIIFYGKYNGAIGYANSILGASIVHLVAQGFIILIKFKTQTS